LAHIFISHASKDDDFVRQLRVALEAQNLPVWFDSRAFRDGDKLDPEIRLCIVRMRWS
jgi:TIR domain-containing protein